MKIGSRGWITVRELRNFLIELPGDWTVTPLKEHALHLAGDDKSTKMGEIDFSAEKVTLVEGAIP